MDERKVDILLEIYSETSGASIDIIKADVSIMTELKTIHLKNPEAWPQSIKENYLYESGVDPRDIIDFGSESSYNQILNTNRLRTEFAYRYTKNIETDLDRIMPFWRDDIALSFEVLQILDEAEYQIRTSLGGNDFIHVSSTLGSIPIMRLVEIESLIRTVDDITHIIAEKTGKSVDNINDAVYPSLLKKDLTSAVEENQGFDSIIVVDNSKIFEPSAYENYIEIVFIDGKSSSSFANSGVHLGTYKGTKPLRGSDFSSKAQTMHLHLDSLAKQSITPQTMHRIISRFEDIYSNEIQIAKIEFSSWSQGPAIGSSRSTIIAYDRAARSVQPLDIRGRQSIHTGSNITIYPQEVIDGNRNVDVEFNTNNDIVQYSYFRSADGSLKTLQDDIKELIDSAFPRLKIEPKQFNLHFKVRSDYPISTMASDEVRIIILQLPPRADKLPYDPAALDKLRQTCNCLVVVHPDAID